MKMTVKRVARLRTLFLCCLLSMAAACCPDALGRGAERRCEKVPAGNWSVGFRAHLRQEREGAPYRILSMKLEVCDGYLYMSDLALVPPPGKYFGTMELTAYVYRAWESGQPLVEKQVFGLGSGDLDYDSGALRTPRGKRWGAPFTVGDSPMMWPLMRDGALEGDYIVEVGFSLISFTRYDEWRPKDTPPPPHDLAERLLYAADYDDVDDVRSLLAAGADANVRDSLGRTPLTLAASSGHERSARLLIKAGADVNAKTGDGYPPLILAAKYGYTPVVRLLLEAGADLDAKTGDGMSALTSACFEGRAETWDVLRAAGAQVGSRAEEFICMAGLGRTAAVEKMLAEGVPVNAKGPRDLTALLLASFNGHAETLRLLLAHGADPNASDKFEGSPLSWAIFARHMEVAKMLIKAGADINHRNIQGETLLIEAARLDDFEGARLLVEAGADVSALDRAGKTALDRAVEYANTGPVQPDSPMVRLLRAAAAKR